MIFFRAKNYGVDQKMVHEKFAHSPCYSNLFPEDQANFLLSSVSFIWATL
jgi:hypothetical protein